MNQSYMVVYERVAEDNWGGWAPDIGGAVGAGDNLDLARQSLRKGVVIQLEDLAERGVAAPQATSLVVDFSDIQPIPPGIHFEVERLTVDLPAVSTHRGELAQQAA